MRYYQHDGFDVLGGERELGVHFLLEPEEHVDEVLLLVFLGGEGGPLAVLLDDAVHDPAHAAAVGPDPGGGAADEHGEARGREEVRQAHPGHDAEEAPEHPEVGVAVLEPAAADDGAHRGVGDVGRDQLGEVHRRPRRRGGGDGAEEAGAGAATVRRRLGRGPRPARSGWKG